MSLSPFPTRLDVKYVVEPEMGTRLNLDIAIQELVDRAYEAGACIDSRQELDIDLSTERVTWNSVETVQFDPLVRDALISVRNIEDTSRSRSTRSWDVIGISALHQVPGMHTESFVDHGLQTIAPDIKRIYQVPLSLEDSSAIVRGLFKMRAPTISTDDDRVPIKTAAVAKLGLHAIHYENESDDTRAQAAWQKFYNEMGLSRERHDGIKKRYISYNSGLRHRPTNFM